MKYNSFVVFGLGKFGQAIADKLLESGADVMVVDNDENLIEQYSAKATSAIEADLTDPAAVKALGISNIDCAIVSMGMSLEASIISTMVSKECGVKWVVAKAGSQRMGTVLTKVGADEVIYPEEESGIRTAKRLIAGNFLEYLDISNDLCLVEMAPKDKWVGRSLKELNLRKKYGANVIAIKEDVLKEAIDPNEPLKASHPLIMILHKNNLSKLEKA